MAQPARDDQPRYTYADYLTWPDDRRRELLGGVVVDMTPAPSTRHQLVCSELHGQIWDALRQSPCRVLGAPLDVRLPEGERAADAEITTVVQPDLVVVCDAAKLDSRGCLGAPDLVVEVLSPSTAYKDQSHKLLLYERHGVREVWIVNPDRASVLVYSVAAPGRFGPPVELRGDDELVSEALPGVTVRLGEVFSDLP